MAGTTDYDFAIDPPSDNDSVEVWCDDSKPPAWVTAPAKKKTKVSPSPAKRKKVLLSSKATVKSQFIDNEWAKINDTHSLLRPSYKLPLPDILANAPYLRELYIPAMAVYGGQQTNKGFERTLNPFNFFSVDYKEARMCDQVATKVCVWCGCMPCMYFEHEGEIFGAVNNKGGKFLVSVEANRAARRNAYQAFDLAAFGPRGKRVTNYPLPFCVEARVKMLWPSLTGGV
jgi:hypothetical protein